MVFKIKKVIKKFPAIENILKDIRNIAKHKLFGLRIKQILKRQNIFIELGAGDKKGENEWITIDQTKDCDIYWDLRKGLPFPNESIAKIYSSHFWEHLSFKESQMLLNDCRRVLAPGGIFSICVPNARIYIEAYLEADSVDRKYLFQYKKAYNETTKIDYVNYMAYMNGDHKYMFDEENLIYILQEAGFRNVHLRGFNPNLDLDWRDFESIYAEAEK